MKISDPIATKTSAHSSWHSFCVTPTALTLAALMSVGSLGCSKRAEAELTTAEQVQVLRERIGTSIAPAEQSYGIGLSAVSARVDALYVSLQNLEHCKQLCTRLDQRSGIEHSFIVIEEKERAEAQKIFREAALVLASNTFTNVARIQTDLTTRLAQLSVQAGNGSVNPSDVASAKMLLAPFQQALSDDLSLISRGYPIAQAIEIAQRIELLAPQLQKFSPIMPKPSVDILKEAIKKEIQLLKRISSRPELQPLRDSLRTLEERLTQLDGLLEKTPQLASTSIELPAEVKAAQQAIQRNGQALETYARKLVQWGEGQTQLPVWLPGMMYAGSSFYVSTDESFYKRARIVLSTPPRIPELPSDAHISRVGTVVEIISDLLE